MSEKKGFQVHVKGQRPPIRIELDPSEQLAYIRVRDHKIAQTIEHTPGSVYLDVDAEGLLVGIEIMGSVENLVIQDASDDYIKEAAEVIRSSKDRLDAILS